MTNHFLFNFFESAKNFNAPQRFEAAYNRTRSTSTTSTNTASDHHTQLQSPTTSSGDQQFDTSQPPPPRSVSILVIKTLNSVLKSGRKVIFRVCDVATVRKVRSYKMFNLYSSMKGRNEEEKPRELETTGHDRFCQTRPSRWVSWAERQRSNNQIGVEARTNFNSNSNPNPFLKAIFFREKLIGTTISQNS